MADYVTPSASVNCFVSLSDLEYLRTILPSHTEEAYFEYLRTLDTGAITLYAIDEGTVVFPKVPLMRIEGPLPIVQLLETTLLTLVNYARYVSLRCEMCVLDMLLLLSAHTWYSLV